MEERMWERNAWVRRWECGKWLEKVLYHASNQVEEERLVVVESKEEKVVGT